MGGAQRNPSTQLREQIRNNATVKNLFATDEHRLKTNSGVEVNLCLSVFICG
jgi:hypothetical protein